MKYIRHCFVVTLLAMASRSAPGAEPLTSQVANLPATVINFDKDAPGKPPAGFTAIVTGQGSGARWVVTREGTEGASHQVLSQRGQAGGENTALLLWDGFPLEDGDVAVRFKIVGESDYQTVGIVYRYEDSQNYHLISVDAKDNSCSLIRIKNGKKKSLTDNPLIVTAGIWHTLRVVFRQAHFTIFFDGDLAMGDKEKSPLRPGRVGLATEGDTRALFSNLTINP